MFIEVWTQYVPCKVNVTPILGVTYFARDPLRSYFDEPQKNEIHFLNVLPDPRSADSNKNIYMRMRNNNQKFSLTLYYIKSLMDIKKPLLKHTKSLLNNAAETPPKKTKNNNKKKKKQKKKS